ncbi:hypothetical protein A2U01_0068464, partial [Trifolium medium]|nr:hypothetical protein [Trifolium medium]
EVTRSLKAQEDVFVMFTSLRMEEKIEIDEQGVMRCRGRVCVSDVPELKRMILELGRPMNLACSSSEIPSGIQ